jgi:tetratricopeptide (TPR) repeat protein
VFALYSLGCQLSDQYKKTGDLEALEESIQIARRILDTNPPLSIESLTSSLLGNQLGMRHQTTGGMADLEQAITYTRRAIEISTQDSQRKSYLINLASRLHDRYNMTGATSDLDEAFRISQQALDTPSHIKSDTMGSMTNHGNKLWDRYLRNGDVADLEAAIRLGRQAILVDPSDADLYAHVYSLSQWLFRRYEITGAMADRKEAVELAKQSAELMSDGRHRALCLHSLSTKVDDLEEAIALAREGIAMMPEDHKDLPMQLSNLAKLLWRRHHKQRKGADLREGVELARRAVKLTPEGHPDLPRRLYQLGIVLGRDYEWRHHLDTAAEAILVMRQAIELLPGNHSLQASWWNDLGKLYVNRFDMTCEPLDSKEAAACFQKSMRIPNGAPADRIMAARYFRHQCSDWIQIYEALSLAIQLIPTRIPQSLEISDKQRILSTVSGLASNAAEAALFAEEDPFAAVDMLEQGRGLLVASLQDIRADVKVLRKTHPDQADKFVRLGNELAQNHDLLASNSASEESLPSTASRGDRRYMVSQELDALISEIRSLDGFEDFIRRPDKAAVQRAASDGPIVVVHTSQYRCDAILIEEHQMRVLPLVGLTEDIIDDWKMTDSIDILEWMWNTFAEPVLTALGFTCPPTGSDEWPHVWWVLTGLASGLPIHAAGLHFKDTGETVMDRVVFSYSLSVRDIIKARQGSISHDSRGKALLIAMEHTPGVSSRLQFASSEVQQLSGLCKSMALEPVQTARAKKEVMSHIPDCNIFHFAGHGRADVEDPSQSYLLLEDWKEDPLRVADLMGMNLRERSPFMAYLSACKTGRVGEYELRDENVGLTSAFQLVGFRHVIGTMWEVDDESSMDMASMTYKGIERKGMADKALRECFHEATRALRNRWLSHRLHAGYESRSANIKLESSGAQRASKPTRDLMGFDGEEGMRSAQWIPFVHYGA